MTTLITQENYLEKLNEVSFPKVGTFWYAVFDNFLPNGPLPNLLDSSKFIDVFKDKWRQHRRID